MKNAIDLLMDLIRSEISDYELNRGDFSNLTENDWSEIRSIASFHSLEHMIGDAALKNDLIPEGKLKDSLETDALLALYRYRNMNFEYKKICQILDEEKIEYIPLKGAIIRDLYPKPWMRSSSDIDLLLKPEDVDRAISACKKRLGCLDEHETTYDKTLKTENKITVEFHHGFSEEGTLQKEKNILSDIWQNTQKEEGTYRRLLTPEMTYYYQIFHMAKHFLSDGGCGIRSFVDLFIIINKVDIDFMAVYDKLYIGGLLTFEKTAKNLAQHWFSETEISETAKKLASQIIVSGTYGNKEGFIKMNMSSSGNKTKYLLSRLWIPYQYLCCDYPSLKGKRILQPLYEVRRWLKLFNPKVMQESISEIGTNNEIKETKALLSDLGLL